MGGGYLPGCQEALGFLHLSQAGNNPGYSICRYGSTGATTQDSDQPAVTKLIRHPFDKLRQLEVAVHSQAFISILPLSGIIAEFPEDILRLERHRSGNKSMAYSGKILLVRDAVWNHDIRIAMLISVILVAKTYVKHVIITTEDVSGTVGVMAIGIHNGKPLRSLPPKSGYS